MQRDVLIVADAIVVELKAVAALHAIHRAQVMSYLKALNLRVALLLNFHTPRLRDGIERVVRTP